MLTKQEKFMELLNPVKENLERFCIYLCANRENARDLAAETILTAYEHFDKLKSDDAFLSYLFTIASRAYNYNKKRMSKFLATEPYELDKLLAYTEMPDYITDVQILYTAIDKLPGKQKEAVILFNLMGLPQKEIADIQGITVANLKVRLFRAKKKLKNLLNS